MGVSPTFWVYMCGVFANILWVYLKYLEKEYKNIILII